ncbi:hypothetical protein DF186_18645, partial [Enterococcus hirae]
VARAGDPNDDFANFENDATAAGLKHLSGHLAGLEASSAIFAALQGAAGIIDPQGKGGLNTALEKVRQKGTQGFQDSLAQAVRNPKF